MKAFFFFLTIFCFLTNICLSLECFYSGQIDQFFEECSDTDRFCIQISVNGSDINQKVPSSYQGCSDEMKDLQSVGIKCNV
uniref:Uncharacterized protein n=1 Tax=Panagrolaimus superbus TaxID=310955 RepID=A0A914XX95_9BILA